MTLNLPILLGIVAAALLFVFLTFKFGKFLLKLVVLLLVLAALGAAAWWYFSQHLA